MLIALISLSLLGMLLGLVLGIANRKFKVEENPVTAEIEAMLPGSNCGQCNFPGCAGAAQAIVDGSASPTCCPAAGKTLVEEIAAKLGLSLDASGVEARAPQLALVTEELCIGCCRCIKVCPTDAIVGSNKQIHNVLKEACTGCGNCIALCPTEALRLAPVSVSLPHWVWPKPAR